MKVVAFCFSAVCLTHTISCRTLQFIESMIHSNGTNKRKLNDNTRYSLTSFLIDLIGSLKRNSYVWAINEKIWKKRGIPIAIEEQFDIDHLERLLIESSRYCCCCLAMSFLNLLL